MREKKEKKKEKDPINTRKLRLRHYWCHKKKFYKMNLTTPKKISNNDSSGSHLSLKTSEPPSTFR